MAEKKLKENEVKIGESIYEIKPIKVKYIRDYFFTYSRIIKEISFIELTTELPDGEFIIKDYLTAVFDNRTIAEDVYCELDSKKMSEIREKVNKLNDIDENEKNS